MSLLDQIVTRIAREGPMRVDEYMATCLLHPTLGYYTTGDPLGAGGDFITAPEISQMFGELVGLALAQCWLDQGAPAPFTLAELGPGKGTLMADALRACRGVPGFLEAAQVVLVEVSPTLRAEQASRIRAAHVDWVDRADDLPQETPLFLFANEFFDALPIRQFVREGDRWRERHVGIEGDRLTFGLGPAQPQPALADRLSDTAEGEMIETCAAAAPVMEAISTRLMARGGAALVVDYGDRRLKGDSLQAVRRHQKVSALETPGQADLTAHVAFESLAEAAEPCTAHGPVPQGVFLERLGITARAQALAGKLPPAERDTLIAAHRRLTHPAEMGNLFKVMALIAPGSAPPPGFDT